MGGGVCGEDYAKGKRPISWVLEIVLHNAYCTCPKAGLPRGRERKADDQGDENVPEACVEDFVADGRKRLGVFL